MKVYKKCCGQCLLGKNPIVEPEKVVEIIQDCGKERTHFSCHKSTILGLDIACRAFYDKFGHLSDGIKLAGRLGVIEWVDQPKQI